MKIVGGKIVQGKTTACGTCHGLNLTGVVGADVPPIAGRSPSYIVRQLWDIQQGTRNGGQAQLMKLVVANLTREDLVNIAAYIASRPQNAALTAAPVRPIRARARRTHLAVALLLAAGTSTKCDAIRTMCTPRTIVMSADVVPAGVRHLNEYTLS